MRLDSSASSVLAVVFPTAPALREVKEDVTLGPDYPGATLAEIWNGSDEDLAP